MLSWQACRDGGRPSRGKDPPPPPSPSPLPSSSSSFSACFPARPQWILRGPQPPPGPRKAAAASSFSPPSASPSSSSSGSAHQAAHPDDSDNDDLADLVHDFMENGNSVDSYSSVSSSVAVHHYRDQHQHQLGSKYIQQHHRQHHHLSELPLSVAPEHLAQSLQSCTAMGLSVVEREVHQLVTSMVVGWSEAEWPCQKGGRRRAAECKGGCIRSMAVKHLRASGFHASLCKSKWHTNGKLPGGEHEFVVVNVESGQGAGGGKEKAVSAMPLIVDMDFRPEFEIARPSKQYKAMVESLPPVFVGKSGKLEQVLHVMSEAAKCSLKQSCMHLPPWRTLDYMRAKWLSPHRHTPPEPNPNPNSNPNPNPNTNTNNNFNPNPNANPNSNRDHYFVPGKPGKLQPEDAAISPCIEQLRRLKSSLKLSSSDHSHIHTLKPNNNHYHGSIFNPAPNHGYPEFLLHGPGGAAGPTGGGGSSGIRRFASAYRGTRRVAAVDFDF